MVCNYGAFKPDQGLGSLEGFILNGNYSVARTCNTSTLSLAPVAHFTKRMKCVPGY